jgi:cysteine synthase
VTVEPDLRHARDNALERCRRRGIVIPTLAEQQNPSRVDPAVASRLPSVDTEAVDPLNLYRITWHNDPKSGGYGEVDALEIPPELSGVEARILGLVGRHFPTGSHKVGAAFGCLVPRLVSGGFDPTVHRAVWPSTGNYCRGGAFDSALLGCHAIAILPEEMSRERFRWLEAIGAEVIATPGCESNVKEIFDACWELRSSRPEVVVFNQFDELGNYLWHHAVTGPAAEEAFRAVAGPRTRLAGWVGATGSAGTLATGDHLAGRHPGCRVVAAEALQCPTLLACGFGGHRIEGIGDKHVPWIHNVRTTSAVTAVDDAVPLSLLRLFNEPAGTGALLARGLSEALVLRLPLLGLSSLCNLVAAIKTARWFELDSDDVLLTSFTDSADLYRTRLDEMRAERGPFTATDAVVALERDLLGTSTDHYRELGYRERKAIHNLKYFTWVEQQGRTVEELNALWSPSYWRDVQDGAAALDEEITAFNRDSGAIAGGGS